MPYPFKPSSRKRASAAIRIQSAWRRRRRARKMRATTSTVRSMLRGNRHNFRRAEWKSNESVTCDALTGFAGVAYEFKLDQISDYLNFNPLFDAFKISAVAVDLIPLNNTYPLPSIQPQIAMAVDFDDATAPTAMEKLLNRKNAKLRPFHRKVTKYVKPKVSSLVYSSGVAQDYKQSSQPNWIDLPDGANVSHYGVKVCFQGTPNQVINFHRRVTYYLTFKEPIVR